MAKIYDVVIVGAGFSGLAAAMQLAKDGYKVRVIEAESSAGGLAGTFDFSDGVKVEKFYHHWFNNDTYVPELVKEIGMEGDIVRSSTKTGMFFNGRTWKLSTPIDLLRFKALSFVDRIRLGLLVFRVKGVRDWKAIEGLSIREWLEPLCGQNVYRTVWEPLVNSKFSIFAEDVNAVWMWKKLVLRGGTRNGKGGEELAYFKGGFGRLAEALVDAIKANGGEVSFDQTVTTTRTDDHRISAVCCNDEEIVGRSFLFTPPLPVIAQIFRRSAPANWVKGLLRVKYLGNVCLVLRLKRSLSETYWMNVNDPGFPFVGVIEHTNFDPPENYADSHIVYLSRYLAVEDPVWSLDDEQYLKFAFDHLQRMFPELSEDWVIEYHVWRSEHAQPVTERNYSEYVPPRQTPYENAFITTMAQIYPEDRGTNYAIREGRETADQLKAFLSQ